MEDGKDGQGEEIGGADLSGDDLDEAHHDARDGLFLMSPADLDAAVGNLSMSETDWEDSGATSREDAVRRRELARFRDDPHLLWRRHVVADTAMVERLAALARVAPNMARAAEVVRRAAVLSRHGRTPLRVPPVVLLGPPGCGKTRYASRLGEALGVASSRVDGSSVTDVGKISGYHPGWKGAGPGVAAKSLLGCTTSSPVVMVDEAEKIEAVDGPFCPLDVLLPILEPSTAARHRDGYYDVPMRADGIIWIFCANSLAGLSAPLLDRCVVVEAAPLSGAERHRVFDDMAAEVARRHGATPAGLDAAGLVLLDGVGLRGARAVLTSALAGALDDGRDAVTAEDLRGAAALLGTGRRARRTVGFIDL